MKGFRISGDKQTMSAYYVRDVLVCLCMSVCLHISMPFTAVSLIS